MWQLVFYPCPDTIVNNYVISIWWSYLGDYKQEVMSSDVIYQCQTGDVVAVMSCYMTYKITPEDHQGLSFTWLETGRLGSVPVQSKSDFYMNFDRCNLMFYTFGASLRENNKLI